MLIKSLSLSIIRTRASKAIIKTVSVLLISCLVFLPIFNLTVSAVDSDITYVKLPFPSPESFGENSCAFVCYNSGYGKYEYFVFLCSADRSVWDCEVSLYNSSASGRNISFLLFLNYPYSLDSDFSLDYQFLHFWWFPGRDNYGMELRAQNSLKGGSSSATFKVGVVGSDYLDSDSFQAFNLDRIQVEGLSDLGVFKYHSLVSYVFDNQVNPGDIERLVDYLEVGFDMLLYTQSLIYSELRGLVYDFEHDVAEDTMPADYTSVSENSDLVDYDEAENKLMNNAVENFEQFNNQIANFDLNKNLFSGGLGNSFIFISNLMNDVFDSNGKLLTALTVILFIGLASFVLGLVNRRKE